MLLALLVLLEAAFFIFISINCFILLFIGDWMYSLLDLGVYDLRADKDFFGELLFFKIKFIDNFLF